MAPPALKELVEQKSVLMPLTVRQYHRMIRDGIVPEGEPYELLNGFLVRKDRSAAGADPMTIGHEHAWVVGELGALNAKLRRLGCHLRVQQPISMPPYDEPEPDASIVVGTNDDYRRAHPRSEDVTCVIEVSDASLRRDRTTKLRIYAGGGIGQYVIVNLPERLVEVYTEPARGRYGRTTSLRPGQRVEFAAARGKRLAVPVKNLLP